MGMTVSANFHWPFCSPTTGAAGLPDTDVWEVGRRTLHDAAGASADLVLLPELATCMKE